MLSGMIQGGTPLGCLDFTGQWVRDALMLSAIAPADRSQGRPGASKTSLCFLVANILSGVFPSWVLPEPVNGSGELSEAASHQGVGLPHVSHPSRSGWRSLAAGQTLLSRRAHGLGVPAHPWLAAGRAGSHGCHRGSPWTPLPAQPSARLGCWGDGLVYLPSGLR